MPKPGVPSHVGPCGEKSEGVVGREKESMAKLGICDGGVVVGLIVEVLVGFWSDDVAAFAHRVPVFFSRSSRRRCFSSQ